MSVAITSILQQMRIKLLPGLEIDRAQRSCAPLAADGGIGRPWYGRTASHRAQALEVGRLAALNGCVCH